MCRKYDKDQYWTNEYRFIWGRQGDQCHWETPQGDSGRPPCQILLNHSLSALGKLLHRAIRNLMPVVKNHTVLDDRTASFDKTKISGETETIKQVFWQMSINDQMSKSKYK